jgi:hypothetical protein
MSSWFRNPVDAEGNISQLNDVAGSQYNILGRTRWSLPLTSHAETGTDMVSPRVCADGWTVLVHPDGWRYFHAPGIVTDDQSLAQQSPAGNIFNRQLHGDDYEEYFSLHPVSNLPQKLYINHVSWCASDLRELVHGAVRPEANAGQISNLSSAVRRSRVSGVKS